MKKLSSYYPVISAENGPRLAQFFIEELKFEAVFSSDWYWHLSMPGRADVNVAIVDCKHPSIPEAYRKPVQGLLLNFEMEDVSAYYEHAQAKGWDVLLALRDEDWGQRHFIAATPEAGLMLDLIEVIPPSEAFLKNYHHEGEPA